MKDIEIKDIIDISDGVIEKTESILDWINQPKEEARGIKYEWRGRRSICLRY